MKGFFGLAIVVLSCVITPAIAQVQETQQAPQFKLVEFHMAVLKRGPRWSAGGMPKEVEAAHVSNVLSLIESGKAIIAGPLVNAGDILGIYVLRAKSAEEAKTWAENDPAVKSGDLVAEMHPWLSEDIMKKPATPIKLTTTYFGLLVRGPKWIPEKTPATEELQKAHLLYISQLLKNKKLAVAGPFGDNGTLRGMSVFKVGSLAEARELAEEDPAVKAGRLIIEVHPWLVPVGVLP